MIASARFGDFIDAMAALTERPPAEAALLARAQALLAGLVAVDDWLPDAFAKPHEQYYRQYLLYAHPRDLFSVVSFVWGPGQSTPIHNHTTWGVIGMLRGAEFSQHYELRDAGPVAIGPEERLEPGSVATVSPATGDIHRVRNALEHAVSISIHAYGANIGRIARSVYQPGSAVPKPFVSGYANEEAHP